MIKRKTILLASAFCLLISAVVWAQGKKAADSMEDQVRKATFSYYIGLVLGEPDEFFKSAKLPLATTLDGQTTLRDDKYLRAMLAAIHKQAIATKLSDGDKKLIVQNMVSNIDDSQVQFIGANTATIAFLIQHDAKKMSDRFCSLVLHKEGIDKPEWKVIQEITDSKSIPPEYVK